MSRLGAPLTEADKQRYKVMNKENLEFLMNRYNKVNRWVIADMIRRSAYRYPDKPALIYGDKTLDLCRTGKGMQPDGQRPDGSGGAKIRSRRHPGPQHNSSCPDVVRLL